MCHMCMQAPDGQEMDSFRTHHPEIYTEIAEDMRKSFDEDAEARVTVRMEFRFLEGGNPVVVEGVAAVAATTRIVVETGFDKLLELATARAKESLMPKARPPRVHPGGLADAEFIDLEEKACNGGIVQ